ncbi:MAG: tryptophan 2,3-dioxygenase family protein [Cytophagales bacterium]|nr:tryptophan 2,3-dioxygenase family protein [Bernardetiaceae bacterium]MDW8210866.1 tryptophan 2,3-dioxygenase family protein [Cytophagales bacterium]
MASELLSEKICDQVRQLGAKYEAMGQDLSSYLDGLLYANYLTYWDYIHLDTLLSLQNPRTDFPDETIFITYHQITELYFKLCLHEIRQLAESTPSCQVFIDKINRISRYFRQLINSFTIMVEGMEPEQFLKFRMSLLPSSGFQSVQFRMIEICATDFKNLVSKDFRPQIDTHTTIEEMYEHAYWKKGATELASGKPTLTLQQFEVKYAKQLIELAYRYRDCNLWRLYRRYFPDKKEVEEALRQFDALVNIDWALAHLSAAMRYLKREPAAIAATGGTNWQEYLPPRFQKRMFYPDLWSEEEKAHWGKSWAIQKMKD